MPSRPLAASFGTHVSLDPAAFLDALWRTTAELAPWLIVGAAAAGVLHAVLPPGFLGRWLGGKSGVWRAVLVGAPLPLCSCAVIPVALGLKRQGASPGAAVGFLIATPQTGVDSVLVTAGLLGWPLALFKVAVAVVTGVAGGYATDAVTPREPTLPIIDPPTSHAAPTWRRRALAGVRHADEVVHAVWLWLVLGVVLSAAITAWVPADALAGLATYGVVATTAVVLAISMPLYVCATASAPIAASLVASGLPLGAAIVFLMAGPATNVATVGAVYRGLGSRPLAAYLGTILVGSTVGAWLFGLWLGDSALTASADPHAGHAHTHAADPGLVPTVAAGFLLLWLGYSAWRDIAAWLRSRRTSKDSAAAPELV